MKRQRRVALFLLSTAAMAAGAQSADPLPEVATLVRQTMLQQRFSESREQDYVFREDVNTFRLTKACTWAPQCPGIPTSREPVGIAYQVLDYTTRHFEIFWLDGIRVARILQDRNWSGTTNWTLNISISDSELAVENQRVDSEVAQAKALRAQGKDASSPDDPPQILFSRMLELCTFSNPRRQVVKGRSTILLDFARNPDVKPISANEVLLNSFSGTVEIDEEDHAVQRVDGRFLADVKSGEGNIKIRKGTRVTINNVRVDTGIWLISTLIAWGEAHYFAFAMDGKAGIFAGNYKKFHATSKILYGSIGVPADSPSTAP